MKLLIEDLKKKIELQDKTIATYTTQMGQLAEAVQKREPGTIPSYTVPNPNHKSNGNVRGVNMVAALRSGKSYLKEDNMFDRSSSRKTPGNSSVLEDGDGMSSDANEISGELGVGKFRTEKSENFKIGKSDMEVNTIPFPEALEFPNQLSYGKKGSKPDDIWETFKQVKINIPLIDAIKQIPSYAKFLKDLCTQKRKLKASLPKKVELTEQVSAVISGSLPPKMKDPGTPLISVTVGNVQIKKALLDLGASINILPFSLVDRHEMGLMKRTDIMVQLADKSIKTPRGVLEDVIVKVGDFYYPVDFIVLDVETKHRDTQPTIILGRPFLATVDALINCRTGVMDISFGNQTARINVFNSLHTPNVQDICVLDTNVEQVQKHSSSVLEEDVGEPLTEKDLLNRFIESQMKINEMNAETLKRQQVLIENLEHELKNLGCVIETKLNASASITCSTPLTETNVLVSTTVGIDGEICDWIDDEEYEHQKIPKKVFAGTSDELVETKSGKATSSVKHEIAPNLEDCAGPKCGEEGKSLQVGLGKSDGKVQVYEDDPVIDRSMKKLHRRVHDARSRGDRDLSHRLVYNLSAREKTKLLELMHVANEAEVWLRSKLVEDTYGEGSRGMKKGGTFHPGIS